MNNHVNNRAERITNVTLTILLAYIFMVLTGCESQYDKGYKNGYSDGKSDGYRSGYNSGQKDGYREGKSDGFIEGTGIGYENGQNDGYIDGTKYFVKDSYIPSLGVVVIILLGVGVGYFLFNYFKDPVKRNVERKREITERERKIKRAEFV